MAENFQRHLLLYGWLPRAAVGNYLKTQCTIDFLSHPTFR
jgi:hypothetical protein